MTRLILASGSPRRRDLLKVAGYRFLVKNPAIKEIPKAGETPQKMVVRLSHEKAHAVAAGIQNGVIVAADTIVVDLKRNKILGKPDSPAHASRMLRMIAGTKHRVYTGICLILVRKGKIYQKKKSVVGTDVWLRMLSSREIKAYVRTGEPLDKAGAYAAQGRGMIFIEKISGSYTNVVGLPMETFSRLLEGMLSGDQRV